MIGNNKVNSIKRNGNKTTKPPPEVLIANRLEKDVQRMIYPVNLMLTIFFTSKYMVKDDYITPIGRKRNTFLVFGVFGINGLFFYRMYYTGNRNVMDMTDFTVCLMFSFYFVFYSLGLSMLFILNIIHSHSNISLVLTIQSIHTSIDFSKSVSSFVFWNWVFILGTCGLNVFMYIAYYTIFNNITIIDIFADFMFITFDMNLVYAIRLVVLLEKYLIIWKQNILMENGQENNFVKMFNVYVNILEAYKLYKKVFQALILYHIIDTFFRCLFYLAILLCIIKSPKDLNKEVISNQDVYMIIFLTVLWLTKDIMLVIIQSIQCEKFYLSVEEAETACIQQLTNIDKPEDYEFFCKSVIHVNRTSFYKMSACGFFNIDASLPVNYMSVLTSYIVVLLQSTFL